MEEKRQKGLCFRCDEKWQMGHRCKRKELSVLLMQGEEENAEPEVNSETNTEESEIVPSFNVSLNSVMGIDNPKTMKLKGKIGDQVVVMMIDPGATHNFISQATVRKLDLPILGNREFGVSLGNGEAVFGRGECNGLSLDLGVITVKQNFYPLELGNSNVILGIQWLETWCQISAGTSRLGRVVTENKTTGTRWDDL